MSVSNIAKLFRQEAKFITGSAKIHQIPKTSAPEIAFIGKSNVGKSSLINTICNHAGLARVSHSPGRTQQINFFSLSILDQDLNLIDDVDDYFLHLQFIKMKKQNTDILLSKLVDYIKDIFLMIGNYLYPSKINSFLEQQILLYPDKQFNKYKNPN